MAEIRLLIGEYIVARKYAKASEVARESAPDFAFTEPRQGELLATVARSIP